MTKSSTTTKAGVLDAARALFERARIAVPAVIVKVGNEYNFGELAIGSSKDKAAAFLAEHADVAQEIEAALVANPNQGTSSALDDRPPHKIDEPEIPRSNAAKASPPAPKVKEARPVTLSFPLPADVPAEALKNASIVVTSKSPSGRRRAGFAFTREELLIPYASLNEDQIAALTADAELIVGLRPA